MSDFIRRSDAMRVLKDDWDASFSREDFERAQICQFHFIKISNIPTAQPKVGEWKVKSFHECFCDNCGFSFDIMKCDFLENMKHCPNCGAKMERRTE